MKLQTFILRNDPDKPYHHTVVAGLRLSKQEVVGVLLSKEDDNISVINYLRKKNKTRILRMALSSRGVRRYMQSRDRTGEYFTREYDINLLDMEQLRLAYIVAHLIASTLDAHEILDLEPIYLYKQI